MPEYKSVNYDDLMKIRARILAQKVEEPALPFVGPDAVSSFLKENFPYVTEFKINAEEYTPFGSRGVDIETIALKAENMKTVVVIDFEEDDFSEDHDDAWIELPGYHDLIDILSEYFRTHNYPVRSLWTNIWYNIEDMLAYHGKTPKGRTNASVSTKKNVSMDTTSQFTEEQELIQQYLVQKDAEISNLELEKNLAQLALYAIYLRNNFPAVAKFSITKDISLYPFVANPFEVSFYDGNDMLMGAYNIHDEETLLCEDELLEKLYQGSDDFFNHEVNVDFDALGTWISVHIPVDALIARWNPKSLRNR